MNQNQKSTKDGLVVAPAMKKVLWEEMHNLPQLVMTERQLCDLELLLNGGLSPLVGFLNEADYISVVECSRLAGGTVWPMPIVLDVPKKNLQKKGDRIVLIDRFSKPVAVMDIESVYTPDKKKEAKNVYGSLDRGHFGVRVLFEQTGEVYLGGRVYGIDLPTKYDFLELRHTPHELKKIFKRKGWEKIVAFQTRNPLHRAHFEIIKRATEEIMGNALIHPAVGQTKDGDIDYATRVRSYKHVLENYAKDFAMVSLLPLAMRMAGPREALWHALIRKNYGATHFLVGRDHAGPGVNSRGIPYYGPYDAQDMVRAFEKEIGIGLITPHEMVFVENRQGYFPRNEVKKKETIQNISGTQLREMLRNGAIIPEWFSFPEVIRELRHLVERQKGFVLFFTGLSGSGKSTIAQLLHTRLNELQSRAVTFLDGDVIRTHLSKELTFSKEHRNINIERIGFVATEVVRHGGIALCAAIAPYRASRDANRERISGIGVYVEVFVDTPLGECKKRDVKGLYAKAEKGLLKGFTGIDDPYEKPYHPEIVLKTKELSPEASVKKILGYLRKRGLV